MCDNFKCYILNVVHACSIVVHKWVWMLGYFTLVSLLYLAISILIFLNIISTLVSVVFLNPFMDFDSVCNLFNEWRYQKMYM